MPKAVKNSGKYFYPLNQAVSEGFFFCAPEWEFDKYYKNVFHKNNDYKIVI